MPPSLGSTLVQDAGQNSFPQQGPFTSGLYDFQECFPLWSIDTALHEDLLRMDASTLDTIWNSTIDSESASTTNTTPGYLQHVHRLWHSRIPDTPADMLYYAGQPIEPIYGPVAQPRATLPDASDIDDQYRQGLENSLRLSSREPVIPSVDFLNVGIRLYFTKVHPIFPIIHSPTFRPSKSNASLLLSICALGCLFTGSAQGFQHGVELFERNHKMTLLKWERLAASGTGRNVMVSITQSCLLAHLFGMLSGSPVLLLTADAFHGLPVAWTRHLRLHRAQTSMSVDLSSEGPQLEDTWRKWAHDEELLRISHGLYIIDVELSNLTHRETFQPFDSYKFPSSAPEATFMARNAREWKLKMLSTMHLRNGRSPNPTVPDGAVSKCFGLETVLNGSCFTANVVLEAMSMAALSERTKVTPDLSTLRMVSKSLASFYQKFLDGDSSLDYGHLQLPILWHMTQMTVLADFNLLEKAVGRDGSCLTQPEEAAFEKWTTSEESRICIKHALMIQRRMEATNATCEPALHGPRALFWAGLVIFCHIRARTYNDESARRAEVESSLSDDSGNDADSCSYLGLSELDAVIVDSPSLKMSLFTLADMLRTLGHWGLARRFADILTVLTNV